MDLAERVEQLLSLVARDVWMGHDELLERHRLAEPDVRYYLRVLLPESARARLEMLG